MNSHPQDPTLRSPWTWIPTLYFGQGLPYVVVMTLSVIMYKNLEVSNTEIALYTSWLYLPWVIKPLWSPLIELFGTKRLWIVALQFAVGASLALVALTIPAERFFQLTLAMFWLMAFSSASHDIAADGFYMLALKQHQQAAFVGVRSTFYRIANIGGQGGLVYLAGELQERTGSMQTAWSLVFGVLCGLFLLMGAYHALMLPRPASDQRAAPQHDWVGEFFRVFAEFFRKPGIWVILAFLLFYRFPEAQLLKLATPFLLDKPELGGLGLSNKEVGIAYGTVGLTALTLGGLAGGWVISKIGLKRALWPLILSMHVPNIAFLALALAQPGNLWLISTALAVEQFGYGLGFTAYLMYMILVADGPHKTAHYAICTGFMALGMMLPGMWSGWLQDQIGYLNFFIWVLVATIPSFAVAALVNIPADFGRKVDE
ncbi:AmpG family muropeptide MFS transporter [Paucibacter sp. M5-1]|uniref:AmpG family muropeptide MFS transporter n=1 Tax=Paucibacter sp. M5-1 TaxID=3015998 RepID=UPI0022B8E6AA|nr:AmpG family muropeptide MFS transporter [Paucibacter sp. M5-1]MCZ7882360.1 AmpG family muropeptide MFS transporter [Paucibacter sp. M5-1]